MQLKMTSFQIGILVVILLLLFSCQWIALNSNTSLDCSSCMLNAPEKELNRNEKRTEIMKRGCMLNTKNLSFSTLRQIQYNLTNDLGTDVIIKIISNHAY